MQIHYPRERDGGERRPGSTVVLIHGSKIHIHLSKPERKENILGIVIIDDGYIVGEPICALNFVSRFVCKFLCFRFPSNLLHLFCSHFFSDNFS